MIDITLLTPDLEDEYQIFVGSAPAGMIYASLRYRDLIRGVTGGDEAYLIARRQGRIVGALPAFVSAPSHGATVINSLPFYGSHGAIVEHAPDTQTRRALLDAWLALAPSRNSLSATLITTPFEPEISFYEAMLPGARRDLRVGQLTRLPVAESDIDGALMQTFCSKTRNLVRKSQRQGFVLADDPSETAFDFLERTHVENMKAIGGTAKPARFFDEVRRIFRHGCDYRLLVARREGAPVAALLLFYHNGFVEYFTPVIVHEHRPLQPLSFLIFEGMRQAARLGFRWWNWGGTWTTQGGVHHFKKGWGAQEMRYHYFTMVRVEPVLEMPPETCLQRFPFFYVRPFAPAVPRLHEDRADPSHAD